MENAEIQVFFDQDLSHESHAAGWIFFGRYLPTGHLIYVHQGVLFGVQFDLVSRFTEGAEDPF